MQAAGVDALLVCGNQYTGFEGAVRYVSGFEIVHRYAYVLIPLDAEPTLVFPREARWIGDKSRPWVREHVWPEIPGQWVRERTAEKNWKRLAVYGLDAVMAVRDFRELSAGPCELVKFDFEFDMARAVKSAEEFTHIRESLDIILDGFQALLRAYRPGRTEAEIMAPAVERFFARGAGPRMMNIVLSGTGGTAEAHFKVPGKRVVSADDLLLYSLEIAAEQGYWVEFSRALISGQPHAVTQKMIAVYPEALEAARLQMREGHPASSVHKAAADVLSRAGFGLGHLSGHSIGVTMIEHPAIGANVDVPLRENMVFSFHPQVVDQEGKICLYTQDMYRVGKKEGENLCDVPWKLYSGAETATVHATR